MVPFRKFGSVAVILLSGAAVSAQLPAARLSSVFPAGGRIGSTFEVTVSGADLDHASALHFSHPGISAKTKHVSQFEVTLATNVPPGIHEVRVAGRFGISNSHAFAAGASEEMAEAEGCDSPQKAMPIQIGKTVNGRANASAFDFYKFAAKAGQTLVIDCVADALDSPMQPVVVLLDASGREMSRSRQGAPIVFAAKQDGEHLLKVNDLLFKGGPDFVYRLSISPRPQIDFVLPSSVVGGDRAKLRFYGRNLPGGVPAPEFSIEGQPLQRIDLEVMPPKAGSAEARRWRARPSGASIEGFDHLIDGVDAVSNLARIALALAPVVEEREGEVLYVSIPSEITGQLYPSNDRDSVQFRATKGQVLWIEVFAQRMGLPMSPFLLVQKVSKENETEKLTDVQEVYPSDANVGGPRFPTGSLDPQWRFAVPEDGEYRVTIRNLFATAPANPANVYRLAIRPEQPDFAMIALAQAPPSPDRESRQVRPWSSLLRKGDVLPIDVLVLRQHDFGGAIELTAEGLPAGVRAARSLVPAGANKGLLFLLSEAEAPAWAGTIRIVGRAQQGDREMVREARSGQVLWEAADYNLQAVPPRLAHDFALAVSAYEKGPVRIEAAEEKNWEVTTGGKLLIPLRVAHAAEFANAAKFKPAGHAVLDSAKEIEIAGIATNAVLELDLSQTKLPEGTHAIHLFGYVKGQHRRLSPEEIKALEAEGAKSAEKLKPAEVTTPVWSAPISVSVIPPPKVASKP